MSQVTMTALWPSASARARALAASGCATPCEGDVLDAYPAIRTGPDGVVSTRATPAFQPVAGSAAPSGPRSVRTAQAITVRMVLTASFIPALPD